MEDGEEMRSASPVFGLVDCRWDQMRNSQGIKDRDACYEAGACSIRRALAQEDVGQIHRTCLLGGPAACVTHTPALSVKGFQEPVCLLLTSPGYKCPLAGSGTFCERRLLSWTMGTIDSGHQSNSASRPQEGKERVGII